MPRYREIFIKKDARIIVWKITESEKELIQLLNNPVHVDIAKSRKAESSRKQYMASRIILEQESLDSELTKDINGKPTLKERHVSITHDHNYVAVMISEQECGIDLQHISPKVLRVKHKFFDPQDDVLSKDELIGLTIAWCIKEAIYKIHGDPLIYFKEHMRLLSFSQNRVHAKILHPDYLKDVTLEVQKIDELYLAYTI
ncbi:4'-phosphopantetheinyl transferase family protein [Parvicella tangerina]|uniref:4'-phosphopantetheinyl transferase domain-containing protein n=1 Tax=Parvicella tangerina TaxID=2829795 RepID=A0A916N989_9FLAO|nr:4'-phosphopantetheinyl transferase superfamily protein [Parvicella tangerina]CAG5078488.1 hypothetical protein CRYO30217_00687 [Parvicella tangerina]